MRRALIRTCAAAFAWLAACLLASPAAHAAILASETYTGQQVSPGVYRYSLTLQNTGTTNIGTLWFGWVVYPPVYDLLPHLPTNVQSPAGWTGAGLNDSFYGGYSAEWTSSTSPLAPGQTLSGFTFDSTDSPTLMTSTSPVFGLFRSDTSWVYVGASQGDPGYRFTPTQVPEPTCLALAPFALMLARRRRARDEEHSRGDGWRARTPSPGTPAGGLPCSYSLPRYSGGGLGWGPAVNAS